MNIKKKLLPILILVPPNNSDHGKLDLESFINNDKSQPKKRDFI